MSRASKPDAFKKHARALNVNIDSGVYQELDDYCKDKGITKTEAIEEILHRHISRYFFDKDAEERKEQK